MSGTISPKDALGRMPTAWAKRRLAEEGPTKPGTDEARMAVLTIAAELCRSKVSEADVLAYVTSRLHVFETGSTRGRALLRQLERSVRLAYNPQGGTPILSGCCRDPRPRTGSGGTGALRATFEDYCDENCARVCPMLRAIKNPERSLYGTPYEALDQSNLWLHGGGLGNAGRIAFQLGALLALVLDTKDVRLSGSYACMKSNGAYSAQHFRKTLKRMHDLDLITLLDKRTGLRRVHVRDADWIADAEERLGVAGARVVNIAEARKHSDDYLDWLHAERSSWGDEDALNDWNPPVEEVERVGHGDGDERPSAWGSAPGFLENWCGLIRPSYEDKYEQYRRPALKAA